MADELGTNKLRVLHVTAGIAERYGGITFSLLPMCRALLNSGISIEIAASDADGPHRRLAKSARSQWGVPVRLFRRDFSERWKLSCGLGVWLLTNVRNYDLVHVHGLWNFASLAACAAAHFRRVPILISPHGMLSNYTWTRSPILKKFYWNLVERHNLRVAQGLHVTSAGEGREIAALNLNVPAYCVPLGLEAEAWDTPRQPGRLRQLCKGRDEGRPIVLFLSRLHPKKGVIDLLLPAFQMVSNAFLVIAGGPDPHQPGHAGEVRAAVDRLGLTSRTHFLGPIPGAERWAAFDGASVFVLPSHHENFGLVVTEAMARAIPVIVTETVYSCEHVEAAEAGLVIPFDPRSLAVSLTELLSNPARGRQFGENGLRYTKTKLTWDQVAHGVVQMYQRTLTGNVVATL